MALNEVVADLDGVNDGVHKGVSAKRKAVAVCDNPKAGNRIDVAKTKPTRPFWSVQGTAHLGKLSQAIDPPVEIEKRSRFTIAVDIVLRAHVVVADDLGCPRDVRRLRRSSRLRRSEEASGPRMSQHPGRRLSGGPFRARDLVTLSELRQQWRRPQA